MIQQPCVAAEFRLLGVDEHQLQLGRTLGVQKRCHNDVQAHRLTLFGGTGDQQVRSIRKVEHLHVARNLLADGNGQFCFAGKEFFRCNQLPNRYGRAFLIGHLKAYAVLQNGSHNALSLKSHRHIIGKASNGRDFHALGRINLVQSNSRARDSLDVGHLNVMVGQSLTNN